MKDKKTSVNCPHCGALVIWQSESKFRPFCSDRCSLIDADNWASEKYSLSVVEAENEEELK